MHVTETDTAAQALRALPSAVQHLRHQLDEPAWQAPAEPRRHSAGISLHVRSLSFADATAGALRNMSFDVQPGEFVALLDARGRGVELLPRLLSGEQPPDRGQVLLDGMAPSACNRDVHLQHRHGSLHRWRRWLLQRALARSPRLLLLDRSFDGLDALQRVHLLQLIEAQWQLQRFTVVLVTHDVRDALALADRVLRIDEGRLVHDEVIRLPRPHVFSGCTEPVATTSPLPASALGRDDAADREGLGAEARAGAEVLRFPL